MKLNSDVDLVYLWCDGSDPEFQRKKLEAFEKTNKSLLNKDGLVNARFVNSDELKYSLRSAEKYAPWIRNIYIVTYEQVPAWLNTKHPKIKIIASSEENLLHLVKSLFYEYLILIRFA